MGNKKSKKSSKKHNEVRPTSCNRNSSYHLCEFLFLSAGLSFDQALEIHDNFVKDFHDGIVDKVQFVHLFKKYALNMFNKRELPTNRPQNAVKIASYVFKAFDRDKSRRLTFSELIQCMVFFVAEETFNQKEILKRGFRIFDTNEDGRITRDDLERVYIAMCQFNSENTRNIKIVVDEILNKYDKNGDGWLDQTEFLNALISLINSPQAPYKSGRVIFHFFD